jgi:glyoxylase-like metal-dependent hydrolase (beta-lactamase superfamily II)
MLNSEVHMSRSIRIGNIEITALNDGTSRLPAMFFPGLDVGVHPEVLDQDGTVHIPAGCFLIRTGDRTILVDAGIGPVNVEYPEGMSRAKAPAGEPEPKLAEGGRLPDALGRAGAKPDEIDTVFLTHLHPDHVGWVAPGRRPYFPNARILFGAADWQPLVADAVPGTPGFEILDGLKAAHAAGRTDPVDGDMVPVAPGLTARHSPGHTPGSYVLIVSSGTDRAYLLGDVVACPLQLTENDITFITDVDPALAARTRESLFRELEGQQVAIGMDHFPGLEFQRILTGAGRQWTTF